MTKTHLVTDRQAEKMRELSSRPGGSAWVVDLLATREALMEKLEAVNRVLASDDDADFWSVMASVAPFLAEVHGTPTELQQTPTVGLGEKP